MKPVENEILKVINESMDETLLKESFKDKNFVEKRIREFSNKRFNEGIIALRTNLLFKLLERFTDKDMREVYKHLLEHGSGK